MSLKYTFLRLVQSELAEIHIFAQYNIFFSIFCKIRLLERKYRTTVHGGIKQNFVCWVREEKICVAKKDEDTTLTSNENFLNKTRSHSVV